MPLPNETKFTFEIQGRSPDTFYVVRFSGEEGLSRLFQFRVDLISERPDLDLGDMIQKTATLTIQGDHGPVPIQGVVAEMEQRQGVKDHYFYHATLVPKLWWLTLIHHNQVFLNRTVDQLLESVLREGGLTALDYEFRLTRQYPEWEYVCQYNETHFTFFSHWLEKYGLYYFFEHPGGKLIVTDSKLAHSPMPGLPTVDYTPPSGLEKGPDIEVLHAFYCRRETVPRKVILQDYNYLKPSLKIQAEKTVKADGMGQVYYYATHFTTPEEGADLATIRAEAFLCRETSFLGQGTIPYFRPGSLFNLREHYRDDYNQEYLIVKVKHQGDQTSRLAGLHLKSSKADEPYYKSQISTITRDFQFRPELETPRSRFYGTLHAVVDAAGSAPYAELDEHGRYKVILPFDRSGREGGKASSWIRMMQPYTGSNHGMHFPLHKGTEVLLTFIDGDPNRPVIAGALSNPENPSVVTSANRTMSALTTSGGNKIHIEDADGSQRILMQSPSSNSFMRIGEPNDPPAGDDFYDVGYGEESSGIRMFSVGDMDVRISNNTSTILGRDTKTVMGLDSETILGSKSKMVLGSNTDVILGWDTKYRSLRNYLIGQLNMIKTAASYIGEVGSFIYDTSTYVGEKVVKAFQSNTLAAQETVWVNEEWMRAHESEEAIMADVWRNVLEETEIVESGQKIAADQTNVMEAKTDIIEEHTKVVESDTKVAATETKLVESSNEIETDKNIIAATVNII